LLKYLHNRKCVISSVKSVGTLDQSLVRKVAIAQIRDIAVKEIASKKSPVDVVSRMGSKLYRAVVRREFTSSIVIAYTEMLLGLFYTKTVGCMLESKAPSFSGLIYVYREGLKFCYGWYIIS